MIETFTCEQGSEEWLRLRMGIPTASEYATVLAKPQKGSTESKTRRTYLLKLAGEIITGAPMDSYSNAHTERGQAMEEEARHFYAFLHDADCERVGFVKRGATGCSPDSLIGAGGMLEIKTALPHILIDKILRDSFPPEHKAQCQGALLVTDREWIDLAIYWPGLPLFVKRAHRDQAYITDLRFAIECFNEELAEIVERVSHYGRPIKDLIEKAVQAAREEA